MMTQIIDTIEQIIENHEMLVVVLDVAWELLPGLAAELIFWTRLWQGVNPSQSELAPVCELGSALSDLRAC